MMSIDRDMTPFEKAKALLEEGELDQSHKLLSELIDQHNYFFAALTGSSASNYITQFVSDGLQQNYRLV